MFVGGKGSQYEVTTPYKVFSEALEAYIDKVKRVSAVEREATVKRMKESLGELGGEVVKIAPSIVDLIGEPPKLEALDPAKERIRFLITVTNFVLILGTKDISLALFLDDLQWADEGSVELLERVAENARTRPLTIIACYRDTEVDKHHPLMRAIDRRREKQVSLHDVLVKPFVREDTTRIVSEILLEEEENILSLTKELHQRTKGNVFFVLELLRSLVDQEIVYFKDNHYNYNASKLKDAVLPTDIVEVLIRRVEDISRENQEIFSYASVMGKEINLEFLSDLTNIPEEGVLDVLEEGIEHQFLVRDITGKEAISFSHERIREAFYARLQESEKISLHTHIGKLLEEHYRGNLEPVFYDLAHHFTQAKIEDKTLLYSIQAGKKAQAAYAHDQAIKLYEKAREILERQNKTTSSEYFDIVQNLGQVYRWAGKFEKSLEALQRCESLIPEGDRLKKATVLSMMGDTLWDNGEIGKTEDILERALKFLGAKVPQTLPGLGLAISKQFIVQELHALFHGIFVKKEYTKDPKTEIVVRILFRLGYAYYFTNVFKMVYIMLKGRNLADKLGPCRLLSTFHCQVGMVWYNMKMGYFARRHLAQGKKIAEDLNDKLALGIAYQYHGTSLYEYKPLESYVHSIKCIEILRGVGEVWEMLTGMAFRAFNGVLIGKNFNDYLEDVEEMIATAHSVNALQPAAWSYMHKAKGHALIGDERLKTEGIKAAEDGIRTSDRIGDKPANLWAHAVLAFVYLREKKYNDAILVAEQCKELYPSHNQMVAWLLDLFPICAEVYLESIQHKPELSEKEKIAYLKKARHFCRWARIKSMIYPFIRGWSYKVNGTCQWLHGNKTKAKQTWEEGIAYIREHTKDTYRLATILMEEASFLLRDNPEDKKAREYLIESKEIFSKLGAKLDLEQANKLLRAIYPEEEVVETRQTLTLTRHLDSLLSVTKSIGSIFVLDELLNKIVEQAIQVTGAERGFLLLYDEKDNTLKEKVSRGIEEELSQRPFSYETYKLSLNMVQAVEKEGEGLFAGEDSTQFPKVTGELKEYQVKEAMCIPLKARDKALGMIYLDNRLAGGTFGEDELELMKSFAVQASISIENAYLVSNLVEQERLKQEMELGRQIQLSLLPQQVPQIKGFAIGGLMQPAKEIGGDYFDYISFDEDPNRLGIVVADVTGKGVDAGMVMGMTKAAIHSLAEQNLTTRELVLKLNKHLCKLLNRRKFITLVYAEYSAEEGTFTWSGAGHEHVIVVRNKQEGKHEVEVIMTGGVILGVFEQIDDEISQKSVALKKGDKIVLYTDGVTEARNADNEMFTMERLVETVKQAPPLSAQELLSHINDKIQQFIGDTPQWDDITLVVMESRETITYFF